MSQTGIFYSRKEKVIFLQEVIKKLSISPVEKDIYNLSLEILDDSDFEDFYKKITTQIENTSHISIAPLTSILL